MLLRWQRQEQEREQQCEDNGDYFGDDEEEDNYFDVNDEDGDYYGDYDEGYEENGEEEWPEEDEEVDPETGGEDQQAENSQVSHPPLFCSDFAVHGSRENPHCTAPHLDNGAVKSLQKCYGTNFERYREVYNAYLDSARH